MGYLASLKEDIGQKTNELMRLMDCDRTIELGKAIQNAVMSQMGMFNILAEPMIQKYKASLPPDELAAFDHEAFVSMMSDKIGAIDGETVVEVYDRTEACIVEHGGDLKLFYTWTLDMITAFENAFRSFSEAQEVVAFVCERQKPIIEEVQRRLALLS